MSRKNNVLIIAVLCILAAVEAYFLQELFTERKELKSDFSRVLERKNLIQQECWGMEQVIRSLRVVVQEKTDLLVREQTVTSRLKRQISREEQDIADALERLNRISGEKAEMEADFDTVLAELDELKQAEKTPLNARLAQMKKELSVSNQALARKETEFSAISRKNTALQGENEDLKVRNGRFESERLKMYAEVQDAKRDLEKQTDLLIKREKELQDMNTLNGEFKKHTDQLSALLVKKELAYEDRDKELQMARAEVTGMQTRISGLETDLAKTRTELEKTTRLLLDVTELSAGLEEKLNPYLQTKKDRNKADELKRKVEVLMSPEN